MNKIILKKSLTSKKTNVTFPNDVPLNFFKCNGSTFVEHPTQKKMFIKVSSVNIQEYTN